MVSNWLVIKNLRIDLTVMCNALRIHVTDESPLVCIIPPTVRCKVLVTVSLLAMRSGQRDCERVYPRVHGLMVGVWPYGTAISDRILITRSLEIPKVWHWCVPIFQNAEISLDSIGKFYKDLNIFITSLPATSHQDKTPAAIPKIIISFAMLTIVVRN